MRRLLPTKTVIRPNWLLVLGPDLFSHHYGLTFNYGKLPPLGEWKRWRENWRIDFRWPISIRRKKSRR